MKTCAIHQPNYFPWIGYWIKLACADTFVLYDSCPLDEQGYTRRVKIQPNQGQHFWSSLELMPHPHGTAINKVEVKMTERNRRVILSQLKSAFNALPFYRDMIEFVENELNQQKTIFNLANFNISVIQRLTTLISPSTSISVASSISSYIPGIPMLLELCSTLDATQYISGTGAMAYLKPSAFEQANLDLRVINFKKIAEKTFPNEILDQSILGLFAKYGLETLKEKLQKSRDEALNANTTPL